MHLPVLVVKNFLFNSKARGFQALQSIFIQFKYHFTVCFSGVFPLMADMKHFYHFTSNHTLSPKA